MAATRAEQPTPAVAEGSVPTTDPPGEPTTAELQAKGHQCGFLIREGMWWKSAKGFVNSECGQELWQKHLRELEWHTQCKDCNPRDPVFLPERATRATQTPAAREPMELFDSQPDGARYAATRRSTRSLSSGPYHGRMVATSR